MKCFVCGGKKPPLTVTENAEGKKITVHSHMCLNVFNSKKRAKKNKRIPLITTWSVKWERSRWGESHSRPCSCPKHNDFEDDTDVRFT